MNRTFVAAEVFLPGDFLREELESRGWTQGQFAQVIGRPVQVVNEIIRGKKRITAETAKAFAAALGSSAELWLSLENAYQLATAPEPDGGIAKRAALITR